MSQYKGTVFLENGDWELVDNPLQHPQMNPTNSRVAHYCKNLTGLPSLLREPGVWTSLHNLICETCGERMPEDIQTAFALHNFDVVDTAPKYGTRLDRFHGLNS